MILIDNKVKHKLSVEFQARDIIKEQNAKYPFFKICSPLYMIVQIWQLSVTQ